MDKFFIKRSDSTLKQFNFQEGFLMVAVKKEEKVSTEKAVEEKVSNVIDVFLDGWFNSFKTFQSFQDGVEQKSLKAFESQKEWIQASREQLTQLEEESKKLATEFKANLQGVIKKVETDFGAQNLTEWSNKFEEVETKVEQLAFSPSKATFELLTKANQQVETALKNALDQQQKNRAEVLNVLGEYINQFKETQNGVINSFEFYKPLFTK